MEAENIEKTDVDYANIFIVASIFGEDRKYSTERKNLNNFSFFCRLLQERRLSNEGDLVKK